MQVSFRIATSFPLTVLGFTFSFQGNVDMKIYKLLLACEPVNQQAFNNYKARIKCNDCIINEGFHAVV